LFASAELFLQGMTIEIAASRNLGFAPAKQVKDTLAG
jgi:hypothetical protein